MQSSQTFAILMILMKYIFPAPPQYPCVPTLCPEGKYRKE
jgi:hypothetical protein